MDEDQETTKASKFLHRLEETKKLLKQQGFLLLERLQHFEPSMAVDWVNSTFQKHGAKLYGQLATVLLTSYFLADIAAIYIGKLIPEPPPSRVNHHEVAPQAKRAEDYADIIARNLFNSAGKIPGEDAGPGTAQDPGGPAIKTTLPFNLVGTLILRDELRSIGTIEDKSASTIYPVRANDEIPAKARILKVEANRVTFLNLSSRQREYVEFPLDPQTGGSRITLGVASAKSPIVEQTGSNQFNISKSEVDKALGPDLNLVLTQARAVPNFENGVASGYKLFQIVPGSIYDKIGLKNEDVLVGLGGEPINDPGKAFEMLGKFRESPRVELQIKRGGKVSTYTYDIR